MNYADFIKTRRFVADLRTIPDCAYGIRNNEEGTYAEPVAGFLYAESYSIAICEDGGFTVFIQFEQTFPDLASAEFELFYYYGRDVGETVDLNLFERVEMACRQSDLDAACRYIQDGLGVDYGDCASRFFSWVPESGGPCDENWKTANLRKRFTWMRDYISQELSEVDARLDDPESRASARFLPSTVQAICRMHGLEDGNTGGNCRAMCRYFGDVELLVTNYDADLPSDDAWLIGVSVDGEPLFETGTDVPDQPQFPTFEAALTAAIDVAASHKGN